MNIYWANSIFSQADRDFNSACVMRLRAHGLLVQSPQDLPFNSGDHIATADGIFQTDTAMIENCDVLIACIDQETIDCGVACEIGIAWALGKRIIGLYTDFRQVRTGEFRMYKNPYVIGCIMSRGPIAKTIDELTNILLCKQ